MQWRPALFLIAAIDHNIRFANFHNFHNFHNVHNVYNVHNLYNVHKHGVGVDAQQVVQVDDLVPQVDASTTLPFGEGGFALGLMTSSFPAVISGL